MTKADMRVSVDRRRVSVQAQVQAKRDKRDKQDKQDKQDKRAKGIL